MREIEEIEREKGRERGDRRRTTNKNLRKVDREKKEKYKDVSIVI